MNGGIAASVVVQPQLVTVLVVMVVGQSVGRIRGIIASSSSDATAGSSAVVVGRVGGRVR